MLWSVNWLNNIIHLFIPKEALEVDNLQTKAQRGIGSNSTYLNQKLSFLKIQFKSSKNLTT